MANTAEGITVGGEDGLDPNDPAAFAAIMEGRGVQKVEGDDESPDTSIASGLTTTAEPGPATGRDTETGKFISNQEKTPPAVAPVQATDTSGDGAEGSDDPEVAAYLEKYNGDPQAALKAAASQASLLGRQGQELGDLRNTVAELRGMVMATAQVRAAAAAPAPLSDDQVTEVASTAIESKGYSVAATEAANVAHTTGDERQYRAVLEQWAIEDPVSMADFNTDFRLWQREQRNQPQEVAPPAWQVKAEEQAKVDQYGENLVALKAELGDQAFAIVASKLEDALEQMPPNVLAMIDSEDPEARAAGFSIVADRATLLASRSGVIAPPVVEGAVPPSVERKLSGARVASGALRPAEKSGEQATTKKDAIKNFKRQIVEADTTSVASGLTYGPTP